MKPTEKNILGLLVFIALIMPVGVKSQNYRMEVGLLGGNSFYLGDANNNQLFKDKHSTFGLLTRYNLDSRFTLKANALLAGISGTTVGNAEAYMNGIETQFDRQVLDAGLQLELNFYSYGAPEYTPGSSPVTPYLTLGLGMTGYKTDETQVCLNIPFGLGLKAKVAPRLNLGCEWSFRMALADDLDYVKNTSGFQLQNTWAGSGSWNKNKDWYSMLVVYLTYDIYGIGSKCFR